MIDAAILFTSHACTSATSSASDCMQISFTKRTQRERLIENARVTRIALIS